MISEDETMMRAALEVAAGGLGTTWPNPSVGCVIVVEGEVIASARTAVGGRPHAETQALTAAGAAARDATIYVTLEPCAHYGQTPPCADALTAAGVGRVVVATVDEDPRVAGAGASRLQNAGIPVDIGVLETEARLLLTPFFHRLRTGIPYIAVDDGMPPMSRQAYDARARTLASIHELRGLAPSGRLDLHVPFDLAVPDLLDALTRHGLTSVLIEAGDPLVAPLTAAGVLQSPIDIRQALPHGLHI